MELPENVMNALHSRQKIEAIRLLREQRGIGLKEAKHIVDEYLSHHESNSSGERNITRQDTPVKRNKIPFPAILAIAAFVWAFVNVVEVIGSLIVLWHHDGYREETFTISEVHYDDDQEAGLTWGFIGTLPDGPARMFAPRLADAKALGYQKLKKMYPPGVQVQVWYNPTVTGTLFQHRTLRVIPHTPDLKGSELAVITRWLLYCLLPFAAILIVARTNFQGRQSGLTHRRHKA